MFANFFLEEGATMVAEMSVSIAPNSKLRAKALDGSKDDTGWLEGYAAVWGNVDAQSEVMVRGCFARSIARALASGNVKLMVKHFCNGGDTADCIGTITDATEDDYGLLIRAEFSSTQLAQDVRRNIIDGHVKYLSVGYRVVRSDNSARVVMLLECELVEVTVTVRPANPQAVITGAKTRARADSISLDQMRREIEVRKAKLFLLSTFHGKSE